LKQQTTYNTTTIGDDRWKQLFIPGVLDIEHYEPFLQKMAYDLDNEDSVREMLVYFEKEHNEDPSNSDDNPIEYWLKGTYDMLEEIMVRIIEDDEDDDEENEKEKPENKETALQETTE
jgi:hypothetical protein